MAPKVADNAPITPSTAARHEQEVVVIVARGHQRPANGDLVGENLDGRRPAARDAQALARASGSRQRSTYAYQGGHDGPT